MEKFREIEDTIRDRTGYGTIGHLVAVLLCDREIAEGDCRREDEIINRACEISDELWDGIIGPCLDRISRELT